MIKRVFLIILDSFGIGEAPDAKEYGDEGSNTLRSVAESKDFSAPMLEKLGLFNIDGVTCRKGIESPIGAYARLRELSKGKDTTIGHWEIGGIISDKPFPTYPNGFPREIIEQLEKETGRKILCNKPYSGTKVINDYGQEHLETGGLIVYTSADSVLQIAAHEEIIPIELQYKYCEIARRIMTGVHGVGRIIARPFIGDYPNFTRTTNRHDFSFLPPQKTILDYVQNAGLKTITVGKINDIFAGKGVSESFPTKGNNDGMEKTLQIEKREFRGLCFINLVDFDMLYGHRNDVDGYARAISEFDLWLKGFLQNLDKDDVVMIAADHGCDPKTESTDHSREYIPYLIYGKKILPKNLGTRDGFGNISATIAELLGIQYDASGEGLRKISLHIYINSKLKK